MITRSVGTFVQIGECAVNMALVTDINFNPLGDKGVCLYFSRKHAGMPPIILKGDARLAFLDWWERQAVITQDAQSPPRLVRPPDTSARKVTPGE